MALRYRKHVKVCPDCGCNRYARLGSSGIYRCRGCGTDFGVPVRRGKL